MQDIDRKLLKKNRFSDGYSVRIYPWDFVWAAAMGVMFALCLELFYRMAVNYNHKYPSDLYYYAVQNYYFVKDDGYINKVPRYSMQFFSLAAIFMGTIYVPVIFERYYKHTFKAFAWHSPTQQAMMFFASPST